uniref:RQC domain-containing protein n=1 Tax=Panagrolaimus superbus TaxID=310955 RepID=A0A914XZ20_9BILA
MEGNVSVICATIGTYQDHIRHRSLKEAKGKLCHAELGKQHKKSIYEMVEYCENVTKCRRKILVEHFGEIYDASACQSSITPCSICENIVELKKKYQLYDITADARIIINGIRAINNPLISYVAELYRGVLTKKNQEKANKANHINLPFFGLGNSLNEADAVRLLRKLVIDGYLDESIVAGSHGNHYGVISPSQKGILFANQDDTAGKALFGSNLNVQKVYIHFSTDKRKSSAGSASNVQFSMTSATKATETDALKDKYRFKHKDIFERCKTKLVQFCTAQAREENFSNYTVCLFFQIQL